MPPAEIVKYIFGNNDAGILQNAGYYYAIRIVKGFKQSIPASTGRIYSKYPTL
jgi:uncharacterized protein YjaZ